MFFHIYQREREAARVFLNRFIEGPHWTYFGIQPFLLAGLSVFDALDKIAVRSVLVFHSLPL